MDYRYRFLSNRLGRFISPDSIIPNPLNPQSLNRYTYVLNSPINYNDPTGHNCSQGNAEECGQALNAYASWYFENELSEYGIDLTTEDGAEWTIAEKSVTLDAVRAIDKELQKYGSETNFVSGYGTDENRLTLTKTNAINEDGNWGKTELDGSQIYFYFSGNIDYDLGIIIHEFGHVFAFRLGNQPTNDWGAWNRKRYGNVSGFMGFEEINYNDPGSGYLYYYFGDFSEGVGEEFADMFVALVLDYSPTEANGASSLQIASGNFRRGFMETSMPVWLSGGSSTPPDSDTINKLYPWP